MAKTILLFLLLAAESALAANMYCCQDSTSGRRSCADSLPEVCRGRPYKIIDGGGNVIKEVAAPLTPEQKAQAEADARRRKEEEAAMKEQRRKDQALLDTYGDVADIDRARARVETDVRETMRIAQEKIAELQGKRQKLANEAEFYKKKGLPQELERDIRAVEYDIKLQNELIAAKQQDMELIKVKYEEDKRRFVEITNRIRQEREKEREKAKTQAGADSRYR